jgi:hypothetical protein
MKNIKLLANLLEPLEHMENNMESNVEVIRTPGAAIQARPNAIVAIESDKAIAEIKGMLTISKMYPRDEVRATEKIKTACQRAGLAETARYTYTRGGTEITGPSIRLAEAVAQLWGNIVWGWKEIERGQGFSVCRAYAWDTENNVRRDADFQVPHYRSSKSKGRQLLTDDRDIYEVCANMASRRMRACLLNVIPGDVIEMAEEESDATLKSKEVITPESIKKVLDGFAKYKVSRAQIEKRLGRSIDAITPGQMVSLRRIFRGLLDGMGKVEDYFQAETAPAAPEEKKSGIAGVKERLKKEPEEAKLSKEDEIVLEIITGLDQIKNVEELQDYQTKNVAEMLILENSPDAIQKVNDAIKSKYETLTAEGKIA